MKRLFSAGLLILMLFSAKYLLQSFYDKGFYERQQKVELFYLPSVKTSSILCFGFNNLYADYMFISSIVYFMEHFKGDNDYEFLKHQFDIIAELDPYFTKAYTFGALTLFIAYNNLEMPVSYLMKAYSHMPSNWRLIQEIAFYYYQFKDYKNASEWYLKASKVSGISKSLKNRFLQLYYSSLELTGEFDKAKYLWLDLHLNAEDEITKELSARRLFLIFEAENIRKINQALFIYKAIYSKNPPDLEELKKENFADFSLHNEICPQKGYIYSKIYGNILIDEQFLPDLEEHHISIGFNQLYPFYFMPEKEMLYEGIQRYISERGKSS